ncbi:hydroxyacid dehydrogenase [Plastoroseomonas hellenica]|uniref:hydroxyacid dehydrogenase n=1 Tax=Plastoroseomonas hellenica TaxID=2687306 RepID=UPI001BAAFF0F|nr:hydroxyacid dehydrogenase [Plastoroseomonas hellenica]MBR0644478.1 hydroxyacid dehydrogenase [Plastoroseomonas hellenica]
MPNILVLNAIHPDGIARLEAEPGYAVTRPVPFTPEVLSAHLRQAEGIITRGTRIDRDLLRQAPRLRFVCRHGVGYDNVDVPALTERGITLAITPEANAASVAEHALMLMLALSRRIVGFNADVRRGDWVVPAQSRTSDLAGCAVLLLGFGRIGSRVARFCSGFGMRVLVHDPYVPDNTVSGLGFEPAPDLASALGIADIVSLHCPSDATTRGMVDAGFLAAMKPGALLVNTARGTLVDEAALEAALRAGHLAGAGLDVVHTEPMTSAIPLLALDSVIVTPHVAASTRQGLHRMALAAAQNTIDFFAGRLNPGAIVRG